MTILEITLGWLGNIGFFLGIILLAKKKRLGFHCNLFANGFYLLQSFLCNNLPLVILSIGLMILNLYGILNWKKEREKREIHLRRINRFK